MIRETPGLAAGGRHDEHVEIAVTIGGESDGFTVVAPDGREVIGIANGQGDGLSAQGRDLINIAFVTEEDGLAIGRNGRIPQPRRLILSPRGECADKKE